MKGDKKIVKVCVLGLFVIGAAGAAQAIAGSASGLQNCCHSYPPPNDPSPHGTATACLNHPCNAGQVCSGTGGTLPNGQPWAKAMCVTPPKDAGAPTVNQSR